MPGPHLLVQQAPQLPVVLDAGLAKGAALDLPHQVAGRVRGKELFVALAVHVVAAAQQRRALAAGEHALAADGAVCLHGALYALVLRQAGPGDARLAALAVRELVRAAAAAHAAALAVELPLVHVVKQVAHGAKVGAQHGAARAARARGRLHGQAGHALYRRHCAAVQRVLQLGVQRQVVQLGGVVAEATWKEAAARARALQLAHAVVVRAGHVGSSSGAAAAAGRGRLRARCRGCSGGVHGGDAGRGPGAGNAETRRERAAREK